VTANPATASGASHAPLWWFGVGAVATALATASLVLRGLDASGQAATASRDLDWLLTSSACLVPAWRVCRSGRVRGLADGLARTRLGRIAVSLGLSAVAGGAMLAVAFAVFLWRSQVAYSREHDLRRLPPSANEIRLAALAPLATMTPDDHLRLRAYLARNYRWMVTTWYGERVAFLRGGAPGARVHGSNGYQHIGPEPSRVQYRLGVYLDIVHPPRSRVPFDATTAGAPIIAVRLLKPPLAIASYDSRLWIAGRSVGVEVFEESPSPERVVSNVLVAELGVELSRLLAVGDAAWLDGLLETGSIAEMDEPLLAVEAGEQQPGDENALGHGVYVVSGAVNPGEEGHLKLRAFDATSNAALEVTALPAPLEFVGWSDDTSRRYRYGFEVIVEDPDEREQMAARFELWFTPSNGGSPRRLSSLERLVRGYRY